MSDNLFTYNELESSKVVVVAESKKEAVALNADSQKANEVAITSLEIAELTGKRHDIVIRDIEAILGRIIDAHRFEGIYKDAYGRDKKCYRLPKREALILVSGYSVELRAKIIDRLEYLENKLKSSTPKLPQTYKEALRELLNQVEQNEQLQIENAKQQETITDQKEIINSYKIADRTKRNKQELATLLNRKIRELADKQYNRQYHKAYLAVYEDFAKLHCFTHKVDMQFLRTNIDYLSECLKLVLDKIQNAKEQK